jgi:hypothetical protein
MPSMTPRPVRNALVPLALGLLTLGLLKSCGGQPPVQNLDDGAATEDPCRYFVAHGDIFELPFGRNVDVTVETVDKIVGSAQLCAESALTEAEKKIYIDQSKIMITESDDPVARAERSLVRIELAAAIAGSDKLDGHSAIASLALAAVGDGDVPAIVQRNGAWNLLKENGWRAPDPLRHKPNMPTYLDNCRAAGVPIPGRMLDDGGWSKEILLPVGEADRYFVARDATKLKLWHYKEPDGGRCVTFLRQKTDIPFIGTICMNAAENKACFFDNEIYTAGGRQRVDEATMQKTDFKDLVHPLDFDDVKCHLCHLGDNPLLVHPNTYTELGRQLWTGSTKQQQFEFVPFGDSLGGWHNPNPLPALGNGKDACLSCHDLPSFKVIGGSGYCPLLEDAANRIMPPKWAGVQKNLWPDAHGCFDDSVQGLEDYFPNMRRLRAMCSGIPVPDCPAN